MPFEHLHDTYLLKSGNSIWDQDIIRSLEGKVDKWVQDVDQLHCIPEFIDTFKQWIASSQNNKFYGLDKFPYVYATLGVTQAIDAYHYKARDVGYYIRVLAGEYPYHRDVAEARVASCDEKGDWINPLREELAISLPFSGNGDFHPDWEKWLDYCKEDTIPVFVDCAWFGTCGGIEVDLSHDAIDAVAFSTTKGLCAGNWRSGIVFSRYQYPQLSLQNKWDHSIHLNNRIGLELMRTFGPDYLYNKYRASQLAVCETYGLQPSKCVHIAQADSSWAGFHRGGNFYRVNIRNAVRDHYRTGACRT